VQPPGHAVIAALRGAQLQGWASGVRLVKSTLKPVQDGGPALRAGPGGRAGVHPPGCQVPYLAGPHLPNDWVQVHITVNRVELQPDTYAGLDSVRLLHLGSGLPWGRAQVEG